MPGITFSTFSEALYICILLISPCATFQTANADSYELLDGAQYSQCPPGYKVPQDECLAAVNAVTSDWTTISNRNNLSLEDWDYTPCGCFIHGGTIIDYNTNCNNAQKDSISELVCKVPVRFLTALQPKCLSHFGHIAHMTTI